MAKIGFQTLHFFTGPHHIGVQIWADFVESEEILFLDKYFEVGTRFELLYQFAVSFCSENCI